MNDVAQKTIIKIFPNSGHQSKKLSLLTLLPNWNKDKISEFVRENLGGWKVWDSFTPWVMYRYEDRDWEQGGPLLSLVIETNLGSPTNGILFDIEQIESSNESNEFETESVYASYDEANIEEDYGKDRCIPLTFLPNSSDEEIEISILVHWIRSTGADPVEVDLIVDLGNTRTVALLLEHPSRDPIPFGHRVQPLRFMPSGEAYQVQNFKGSGIDFDDLSIIDSWFVLKRSNFADLEPPYGNDKILKVVKNCDEEDGQPSSRRKILKLLANSFVEVSPALIGGGSRPDGAIHALTAAPLDEDARFTMGSPKRYAWDDRAVGSEGSSYWSQIPGSEAFTSQRPFYFEKLDGVFRMFMDPEGNDWNLDGLPKEEDLIHAPFRESPASFPRRDSICWFALSIIEAAYRQMNSENYLEVSKRRTLPRKLSKVSVLYPSGWTQMEKNAYFKQWKRALKIFTINHLGGSSSIYLDFTDGSFGPGFEERGLDEAMCAQLPVIYSEVSSLGGCGIEWLKLYGDGKKVRVINVDIGGGTTDFSVIEYRAEKADHGALNKISTKSNDPTARLVAKLLYKDGKTVAGDSLVKKIIEKSLIPLWIGTSLGENKKISDEEIKWILQMFAEPESIVFADVDSRLPSKLSRIVRLLFLPVVNALLAQLSSKDTTNNEIVLNLEKLVNSEMLNSLNQLMHSVLSNKIHDYFGEYQSYFSAKSTLNFQRKKIEKLVDEAFAELLDDLLQIFREFPCDLVILSGKPSELSRVRERIEDGLPLLPQRIINLNGYCAGDWYPFAEKGRVCDAKTAAVVGAALHQDILNGNLRGFSLREEPHLQQTPHYWACISDDTDSDDFFTNLIFDKSRLDPDKPVTFECDLPLGSILGRKSFRRSKGMPEPVYQLRYDGDMLDFPVTPQLRVKLKWSMNDQMGEHIELTEVRFKDPALELDPKKVSLKLRTLLNESHWIDSPKLKIGSLAA